MENTDGSLDEGESETNSDEKRKDDETESKLPSSDEPNESKQLVLALPACAVVVAIAEDNNLSSCETITEKSESKDRTLLNDKMSLFDPETWNHDVTYRLRMNAVIEEKVLQHVESAKSDDIAGNYGQAIVHCTKAINLRPDDDASYAQRGECFLRIADLPSAILNYKKACLLRPRDAGYHSRLAFLYYLHGGCLFDQKLFVQALEAFARAKDLNPDNLSYLYRSIACMAALGHYNECLALVSGQLSSALSGSADQRLTRRVTTDLYTLRARIHSIFGNMSLCYYDVRDAVDLDPDHDEARKILSALEEKASDLKDQSVRLGILRRNREALQHLTFAIDANPTDADLHVHRGAVHRRTGDFDAAIDDYLMALDKTDHDEDDPVFQKAQRHLLLTYNDFAVECCGKRFYEEAIDLLNKAIREEKTEKGLYLNRGDCFYKQNEMNFALADFNQAFELDPSDFLIHERIADVHGVHANRLFEEKNYKEAEKIISLAIQFNPLSDEFYTLRSKCRELLMDGRGARRDAILGLHLNPNNTDIISLMTRLYPGKSIGDVAASPTSLALKQELDGHALMRTKPNPKSVRKLKTNSSDSTDSFGAVRGKRFLRLEAAKDIAGENIVNSNDTAAVGASLAKFRRRPTERFGIITNTEDFDEEKEFHLKLVDEKKKMKSLVRRTLRDPIDLKRKQTLNPTRPRRADETARQPINRTEQLLVTGWCKFKLGVLNA